MKGVFVSTYPPARCGIGSFCEDLYNGMQTLGVGCDVVALGEARVAYAAPVKLALSRFNLPIALSLINKSDFAIIQHEFSLYPRIDFCKFLRYLRVPYVVVLHTIIKSQRLALRQLAEHAGQSGNHIVTTSLAGQQRLRELTGAESTVIPLCVRDAPFVEQRDKVISSFGLIAPNKNIHLGIEAMPQILEEHPDAIYRITGVVHPRSTFTAYRSELQALVQKLGLQDNVQFQNEFVEDLYAELLKVSIVLLPYADPEQVSSSTLMHAMACGCAVAAFPFAHATEMLSAGRGLKISGPTPENIARCINNALNHDLTRMRRAAYDAVRENLPHISAMKYLELLGQTA